MMVSLFVIVCFCSVALVCIAIGFMSVSDEMKLLNSRLEQVLVERAKPRDAQKPQSADWQTKQYGHIDWQAGQNMQEAPLHHVPRQKPNSWTACKNKAEQAAMAPASIKEERVKKNIEALER